ncbi:MAG: glycoside hydrolase family 2 TIM barrel-domain containing protein [Anaerolineae bacterium]
MRIVQTFTQNWQFAPFSAPLDADDKAFQPITLPHTNKLFSRISVDNAEYQFVSTYRKRFTLDEDVSGRCVFVDFEGAMLVSTVYLNGVLIGTHKGGFTPFSFEITPHLVSGENVLTVYVDSTEDPSVPPYGGTVDFLTFGGIYREVSLRMVDPCHLVSVFPRPTNVLSAPRLDCDIQLSAVPENASLELKLESADGHTIAAQTQPISTVAFSTTLADLSGISLWSLEKPTLYTLRASLVRNGQVYDEQVVRFGFREAAFRDDGFYLNGQPLKLRGLNRHQTYPYLGAAAPQHLQELDADILKHELGCTIVRTSHYPQSPHFLNRCDEIGLLVFEELPGWHAIGDPPWKALALRDLQAMILRDRHHPSVILWGARINESPDDHEFYTQTNALAHQLDPTRQTGGVRDFIESERLEDVFTLNDFRPGLQAPRVRPHLVTEFAGHMFPTKTWDHEERRIEHALHHANKMNLQWGHPDVAGGIGWCAFDYHTHKEFGSGDRICYHGVMDIYRLPKMAAHFYRSQKSPLDEIVLYAATNWTMGDRDKGGNNPLIVFSNCDEIEVFIGDVYQGRFQPDRTTYPYLEHPPFVIRAPEPYNPWGTPFHDLWVRGMIAGEVVAEHRIDSAHIPHTLRMTASKLTLNADGIDAARIAVQVVDRYNNVLPYQMRVVQLSIEGDAALIGQNPLVLMGGQAAVFIKSRHSSGVVNVFACSEGLPTATLSFNLRETAQT